MEGFAKGGRDVNWASLADKPGGYFCLNGIIPLEKHNPTTPGPGDSKGKEKGSKETREDTRKSTKKTTKKSTKKTDKESGPEEERLQT